MKLFCYGVLLNEKTWARLGMSPKFLYPALLENYKLVFDGQSKIRGGGTANVIKQEGGRVWGAVFEISEPDLKFLDEYEGVPQYYQRKEILVNHTTHGAQSVVIYLRDGFLETRPSSSYLEELIEGAERCMLPPEYITKLKTLKDA
ncbi:MAG: gamma-glutamylcyclotransferase [Candidatus Doudnabacteria bacterium]|nr:gamma-glutamylcyclotransferase [Candidatus Doudnabacteria bacterium]